MKTANNSIASILHKLPKAPEHGIYSTIYMKAAGFNYINQDDTVRCDQCELEISNWTHDMNPFSIHKQRSPTCPFIKSILPSQISPSMINSLDINERPVKRLKADTDTSTSSSYELFEIESVKQARRRAFSHWSRSHKPTIDQFIDAGFFSCNVGDRVICIYCDKIIQTWTPDNDPFEIHKTISPNCPYVINILMNPKELVIPVVNNVLTETGTFQNLISSDQLVTSEAVHATYKEIPKRYESFENYQIENQPSVDDFVRAGFFYTGTRNIVTCFYCNNSLQNWGATDNPMIEHARWFPNCAYIKQLCGQDLFQRIQRKKELQKQANRDTNNMNGTHLSTVDNNTIARYVSARLDLPMSKRMLDLDFSISVIKRCWEDQLKLKHDDFISVTDLHMACRILQKQIDIINGNKANIIIPADIMKRTCNEEQKEEIVSTKPVLTDVINIEKKTEILSPSNPCVLCLTEEKCLAFIPCGHLASCVPCGHSLKSCPICRSQIKASVRIYV